MFPIDIDFSRLKEVLTYDPQAPMIFSSGIFLWLFAAFMVVYVLLQRKYTARILFVTLFSYYFYYKSSGTYFFLLAIVTVADFFLAQLMDRAEGYWKRKGLVVLSLSINLGLLVYFKYTNFLGGVIASLMGGEFNALDIFLPVGISFFTFQSLSYTIDVYRRDIKPLTNLLDYAFYVSFFPQLVAGPIVRARDFIPQIRKPLFVSQEMFGRGIFLIVSGLFKKAIISDYISINFVERIFDNPTLYSGVENLMGVYGTAIHESQSLFFEMQLGRSERFLHRLLPAVRERFGDRPAFSEENFVAWNQRVKPGFIRVDADEVSYPAHVILRYEIERALIDGEIEVEDIPSLWDEKMQHWLGLSTTGNYRDGCMQDIHWTDGGFGYFPSYTLGAMYAAQLMAAARRALPTLDRDIAEGDFSALFDWLRQNIWQHGSRFTTSQLIQQATGEDLNSRYFRDHLTARYL